MTAPLIRLDRVRREFGRQILAVADMTLTIDRGDFISFLDPSGCGKSTALAGATGTNTGLASRIIESSFRNEIPRMFAAPVLVSLLGVAIFLMTSLASKLVLGRWHESEIKRET